MPVPGKASDDDSVHTILSWVDEDAYEVSQTCSVDDVFISDQEDNEVNDSRPETMSVVTGEQEKKGTSLRDNKHRINTDYIRKKMPKRNKLLMAITLEAACNAGNPNNPSVRVLPKYDETMGVSVFVTGAPYYVSFYSMKEILTGD